ncbi:uncharacterized protein LOC128728349 [Anopheles nili]|uniref:uncharacterized protein LOC128728349 n=1 Tax=Anopheles nili TaxID=185578 RepID=UPI00237B1DDC|nr:uncharacterized protein LOC128728349 [Anopheles nili]
MSPAIERSALLLAAVFLLMVVAPVHSSLVRDLAIEASDLARTCLDRAPVSRWDCVKNQSLAAVRHFSLAPRITLLDGIQLVQAHESLNDVISGKHSEAQDVGASTWSHSVLDALRRLLETHVLEIDLPLSEGTGLRGQRTVLAVRFGDQRLLGTSSTTSRSEGRHRRRQQMIPMMIFGVTVFGMFIIPIAFQFLTALSGKAFLMAKLALLLASMNGLKRVASAGVHYGLYHAVDHPAPPLHQHSHLGPGPLLYDRAEVGLYPDGPRSNSGVGGAMAPLVNRLGPSR